MDTFVILRNLTIFFASAMLLKYSIYLLLAPWYTVKEAWRRLRNPINSLARQPLVTVFIPAWNEEVGVTRSIQSLVEGDYSKVEIVVINDGSTDATDKVVRSFLSNTRKSKGLPKE